MRHQGRADKLGAPLGEGSEGMLKLLPLRQVRAYDFCNMLKGNLIQAHCDSLWRHFRRKTIRYRVAAKVIVFRHIYRYKPPRARSTPLEARALTSWPPLGGHRFFHYHSKDH